MVFLYFINQIKTHYELTRFRITYYRIPPFLKYAISTYVSILDLT